MKTLKILIIFAFCCATASIGGCATNPNKIAAAYVSPLKYKDYDCDQIALELDYISKKTTEIYYRLKKESNNDKWQMGVGLLIFWPSLFLLEGGDGPEASEFAQLKGEFEALRKVAVEKKCDTTVFPESLEDVLKEEDKKAKEEASEQDDTPAEPITP